MPRTATITAPDGRTADLVIPDGADEATIRAKAAAAKAALTRAPAEAGLLSRLGAGVVRAAPMLAGASRGAALGLPVGGIPGAIAGAGLGAGTAVVAQQLGNRLLGAPTTTRDPAQAFLEGAVPAAIGEGLPALPGTVAAGVRAGAQRLFPRLAPNVAQAGRFAIPLGIGEAAESPLLSRLVGRLPGSAAAGAAQADAVLAAGTRALERLGGTLGTTEWAGRATRTIRQHARILQPLAGGGGVVATDLATATERMLADLQKGKLAERLLRDPTAYAEVLRVTGREGMQDLQRAWWTGVLESATVKTGPRTSGLSPQLVVRAWDHLGKITRLTGARPVSGQTLLFGERTPAVRAFVDTLRLAQSADVGSQPVSRGVLAWETLTGLLGISRHGPGALAAEAVSAAAPWIAGKLLTAPGGAEWLAAASAAARDPALYGELAPHLTRTGTQLAAQVLREPQAQPPALGFAP